MKRIFARALMALALAIAAAHAAQAQSWPPQSVRLIVPATAGSSLDVVARILADKLQARWNEAVVVEVKPGGGGTVGMNALAKAKPDGLTLAIGFNGPVSLAPLLYATMTYDPAKDLLPVVLTTSQPNVLAVAASHPAQNVAEFVAWAKAQDGKLLYASVGPGSTSHLTMELFKRAAGFEATHVPYRGSPQAAMSVVAGETHAIFAVEPALLGFLQSHQLKLIAATSEKRTADLLDVPTLAESGYPSVVSIAWNGLFAPAGTPSETVNRINADVAAVLGEPSVRETLRIQGMLVGGGSPAEFKALVEQETAKWAPIIRAAGIKLE
jgi:tripartite-type tricarboxylate transporter receptor subunit TctC